MDNLNAIPSVDTSRVFEGVDLKAFLQALASEKSPNYRFTVSLLPEPGSSRDQILTCVVHDGTPVYVFVGINGEDDFFNGTSYCFDAGLYYNAGLSPEKYELFIEPVTGLYGAFEKKGTFADLFIRLGSRLFPADIEKTPPTPSELANLFVSHLGGASRIISLSISHS